MSLTLSHNTDLVDHHNLPNHIAIIMDGNARYAQKKLLPLKFGHKKGVDNLKKIADCCIEFNIKFLTVYAFSSENWNRPKDEVSYLIDLLKNYLNKDSKELIKHGIKILISGNLAKLDHELTKKIKEVEKLSENNNKLILNVAFSYGARQEIVDTTKKIIIAIKNQEITIDDIDETQFQRFLYQPSIPDPDLLIRTAGDQRISNFLLWQIAYTELYFCNKFWPEFSRQDLLKAIENYKQRERRYGVR